MPTYDYECGSCEHSFELFQSITEPVKKKCPRCGRKSLRRLFGTGAAILFKGSGFYQTDYRSESYKKGAEAEKKSADTGSGSKSSESKTSESKSSESKVSDSKVSDSKASGGGSTDNGKRHRKKAAVAGA